MQLLKNIWKMADAIGPIFTLYTIGVWMMGVDGFVAEFIAALDSVTLSEEDINVILFTIGGTILYYNVGRVPDIIKWYRERSLIKDTKYNMGAEQVMYYLRHYSNLSKVTDYKEVGAYICHLQNKFDAKKITIQGHRSGEIFMVLPKLYRLEAGIFKADGTATKKSIRAVQKKNGQTYNERIMFSYEEITKYFPPYKTIDGQSKYKILAA